MAMLPYNAGLDELAAWTTSTFRFALLTAGTHNPDQDTVGAVLSGGATEATASGYARVDVSGEARTVDDTGDRITYTCDDPDFGTLAAGDTITAVLLLRHVTDDSDSVPVGWWDVTPIASDGLDPFVATIPDGIVAYTDAA